jgi:hypothetical protein
MIKKFQLDTIVYLRKYFFTSKNYNENLIQINLSTNFKFGIRP